MKKKISYLAGSVLVLAAVSLGSINRASAFGEGTLMGNESGTKFCCASGTNSCSAAGCKTQIQ